MRLNLAISPPHWPSSEDTKDWNTAQTSEDKDYAYSAHSNCEIVFL